MRVQVYPGQSVVGEAGTIQDQQGRQDKEGAVPDTPTLFLGHATRDKCSSQVKVSQPRQNVSLSSFSHLSSSSALCSHFAWPSCVKAAQPAHPWKVKEMDSHRALAVLLHTLYRLEEIFLSTNYRVKENQRAGK